MLAEVQTADAEMLWKILLNIEKALVEKDGVTLERSLSIDFIGATPTGQFFNKADYIHHHCKPGFGIIALSETGNDSTSIRFYNNTAVVNRRVHARFKLPTGQILEYDVQRLEVFIKEEREWLMVSGQGTQVNPLNAPKMNEN